MKIFQHDWQDPDEAVPSDPAQQLRGFLNKMRLWMGSDHGECQCASYEGTVGGLQASVKFLRMVRDVYKGSDEAYAVFDACFILLDKMLHREIGHQEVFDRLHCMFVNDSLLVEALLWLGALNVVWTRTEVEERIRDLEDHYKERLRDFRERIREYLRPV
jgi:hypothetical protein